MVQSSSFSASLSLVVLLAFVAFPAAGAGHRDPGCADLPPNVEVARGLEPEFLALLSRSPTIRRQCAAIASADVRVGVVTNIALRTGPVRARATIARQPGGFLSVSIELSPTGPYAELVAHEFEHVIEQIEGVDLKALHARGGSAVLMTPDGAFETARAIAAGRQAENEVHAAPDPAISAAAKGISLVWRTLCTRSDREHRGRIRAGAHKEF